MTFVSKSRSTNRHISSKVCFVKGCFLHLENAHQLTNTNLDWSRQNGTRNFEDVKVEIIASKLLQQIATIILCIS